MAALSPRPQLRAATHVLSMSEKQARALRSVWAGQPVLGQLGQGQQGPAKDLSAPGLCALPDTATSYWGCPGLRTQLCMSLLCSFGKALKAASRTVMLGDGLVRVQEPRGHASPGGSVASHRLCWASPPRAWAAVGAGRHSQAGTAQPVSVSCPGCCVPTLDEAPVGGMHMVSSWEQLVMRPGRGSVALRTSP